MERNKIERNKIERNETERDKIEKVEEEFIWDDEGKAKVLSKSKSFLYGSMRGGRLRPVLEPRMCIN